MLKENRSVLNLRKTRWLPLNRAYKSSWFNKTETHRAHLRSPSNEHLEKNWRFAFSKLIRRWELWTCTVTVILVPEPGSTPHLNQRRSLSDGEVISAAVLSRVTGETSSVSGGCIGDVCATKLVMLSANQRSAYYKCFRKWTGHSVLMVQGKSFTFSFDFFCFFLCFFAKFLLFCSVFFLFANFRLFLSVLKPPMTIKRYIFVKSKLFWTCVKREFDFLLTMCSAVPASRSSTPVPVENRLKDATCDLSRPMSDSLGSLSNITRSPSGRGPAKPIRVREKRLIVKGERWNDRAGGS